MKSKKLKTKKIKHETKKMKGGGTIRIPITGFFLDDNFVKLPNPEDKLLFIDIPTDRKHKRTLHNIRRRLRKLIVEDLVYGYSYLSKKYNSQLPENIIISILIYINSTTEPHRITMNSNDVEIPDNDSIYDLNKIIRILNEESKIDVVIVESAITAFEFAENRIKYDLKNKQSQVSDDPAPSTLPTSFFNSVSDPIISENSTL